MPASRFQQLHPAARLVLLSALATALLLSDDFLQKLYTGNNQATLERSYILSLFATSMGLWWTGSRVVACLVLGLFAVMQFFQLAHISYVGQPISPVDISRIASEWGEISEVAGVAIADHWPVLLVWGIPYGLLFWLFGSQMHQFRFKGQRIAMALIVVALLSKPYRAMTHNLIQFMPGPTRSSLHNSLSAYSFYAMRLSFGRVQVPDPGFKPYTLTQLPATDLPDHLWILHGETIRGDRMSAFGHPRDNTPQLAAQVKAGTLQAVPGVTSAAGTGASLPLFYNGVREPGNLPELRRRTGNLFRQAKRMGYTTFWMSTQESKLLNDLEADAIDVIFTKDNHGLDIDKHGDRQLLTWLKSLPPGTRTFGVFNTRAAHAPYSNGYSQDAAFIPRWPDAGREAVSNTYDNALLYWDGIAAALMQVQRERFSGKRLFVITADHGEMLGEDGRWGHNTLTATVASIPAMLQATGYAAKPPRLPDVPLLSNIDLHGWVLNRLGARLDNPNPRQHLGYLQGVDLYMDNLYVTVDADAQGRIRLGEPELVSRLAERRQAGAASNEAVTTR